MKLRHDEHELTRPLENDEKVVEIASFIAVYRNFFKEGNIEHFHDYWNWSQENGMRARSRIEGEGGTPTLEKEDMSMGMDKYIIKELSLTNEFNEFFKFLNTDIIRNYTDKIPHLNNPVAHEAKIQNTHPGQGYHVWHCEWTNDLPRRVLAWALFLNDVDEGGELEFLHQGIRIKPRKGDFVVWPSMFTHLHRGNPPISNDKWIVTGWYEDIGVGNDITA
jgi:hypothetical protein|tara:strand:+ start:2888 stop:3547 length:660 start_codon:yes stop_codon:yes gene_type:complete